MVHITGAGSAAITAHQAGDDYYYAATDVTQSFMIDKADAVILVNGYSVTYDGAAHTATGTATGVVSEVLVGLDLSATTHTSAGSYVDSWTFTDVTGNYNDASGTVMDIIAKADATVTLNNYSGTYDGSEHTASVIITGVGSDGILASSSVSRTNAGADSATAFISGLQNYNDATGTAAIDIAKADAVVYVAGYSVTYDGAAHTASGMTVGVLGESLIGLDLSATTHTSAGSYVDSWTFTDVTGNYNDASGTVMDAIAKAGQSITFAPLVDKTYGDPDFVVSAISSSGLPVTFTATGDATVTPEGLVHLTGPGSATITAHQVGDGNFNPAADVVQTFTIVPANQAPVATDFTVPVNSVATTINVLAHANDPDVGDTLTLVSVSQGSQGSVVINPDGTVTYTLNSFLSSADSFTYTVSDADGLTATATVTLSVELPPASAITVMQAQIDALDLPRVLERALNVELDIAEKLVERGRPRVAAVQLRVFQLHVLLLERLGGIDEVTSDLLIGEAAKLIDQLS
jgi:hypothetical protein